MKQKLMLLLLLIVVQANGQRTIDGQILSESGDPILYANILLYHASDSSFVTGVISDEQGRFSLTAQKGAFGYLEVVVMGYLKRLVALTEDGSYHVTMIGVAHDLEQITVVSQKPLFEKSADRLVVNVSSNVTNMGGTALEALEKSPGVSVNRATNSISISGRQGVLVMIDNKVRQLPAEALMSLLNSISVNEIDRLEILTNPSAKYDAGGGAIVHVVTKKGEKEGFRGNFGGAIIFYDKPGGALNGSLDWKKDKMSLFISGDINLERPEVTWAQDMRFMLNNFAKSRIVRNEKTYVSNFSFGSSYDISEKSRVQILLTAFGRDFFQEGENMGTYQINELPIRRFATDIYEENRRNIITAFGGVEQDFGSGHALDASVEYLHSVQRNPSTYQNDYGLQEDETVSDEKRTPIDIWISKLEYNWELDPSLVMGLGIKYYTSDLKNDLDISTMANGVSTSGTISDRTELEEDVFAAFLSIDWNPTPKWKLAAGMRFEHTKTFLSEKEASLLDRNYGNLFPSLSSSFQFSDRTQFSFSYGKRIARPKFEQLAPFIFYSNPVTVVFGNTKLLPANSHNMDFNFSVGQKWISLSYSNTKEGISGFQPAFDQALKRFYYDTQNIFQERRLAMELGFPIKIGKWLEWTNTLTISQSKIKPEKANESVSITGFNLQCNLTCTLPRNFSVGLNGFYARNQHMGIMRFDPYSRIDIGLQKKVGSYDGKFGLTFTDVFRSLVWNVQVFDQLADGLKGDLDYGYGFRGVRLSYSQSFGNRNVAKKAIETGSSSEMGRLN